MCGTIKQFGATGERFVQLEKSKHEFVFYICNLINNEFQVWFDYKCYVKKKLTTSKMEITKTGGGPSKHFFFSDIEEEVIRLTGMQTSISGIPNTKSFGILSNEIRPGTLLTVSL